MEKGKKFRKLHMIVHIFGEGIKFLKLHMIVRVFGDEKEIPKIAYDSPLF